MRMTTRIMAAVFAGIMMLAACGGDGDDSNAQSGTETTDGVNADDDNGDRADLPDPCELVTRRDAEELFGRGIQAQEAEDAAETSAGRSCIWENVGNDELGNPSHLLNVNVYEGEQFYGESVFDNAQPIDIGDRGFVSDGDGLAGVDVQFVKDDIVFTVNYVIINIGVEGDTDEAASKRDTVIELAKQAAGRM